MLGQVAIDSGFFAQAYNWNGTTVISYRGTNFDLAGGSAAPFWPDLVNGWSLFTGVGTNSQADFATQFFNAITHAGFPSGTTFGPGNTILTGHSLGGGLAGYVGTQALAETVTFSPIRYVVSTLQNVLLWAIAKTVSDLQLNPAIILAGLATSLTPDDPRKMEHAL